MCNAGSAHQEGRQVGVGVTGMASQHECAEEAKQGSPSKNRVTKCAFARRATASRQELDSARGSHAKNKGTAVGSLQSCWVGEKLYFRQLVARAKVHAPLAPLNSH